VTTVEPITSVDCAEWGAWEMFLPRMRCTGAATFGGLVGFDP
jgi:hypothetical protein